MEDFMYKRFIFVASIIVGFSLLFSHSAQTQSSIALAGRITSSEEAAMEGVLVSAKRVGSTITVTVASDEQGRYRFPSAKLQPGRYALRIRAIGYDLDGPRAVDIAIGQDTAADLK